MLVLTLGATLMVPAAQPGQRHLLPKAASTPLASYFTCLFDPLAGAGGKLPAAQKKLEQVVTRILTHCARVKLAAREEARHSVSTNADRAEVDRALLNMEGKLHFVVVEREKAIASDAEFCRARGEKPGC